MGILLEVLPSPSLATKSFAIFCDSYDKLLKTFRLKCLSSCARGADVFMETWEFKQAHGPPSEATVKSPAAKLYARANGDLDMCTKRRSITDFNILRESRGQLHSEIHNCNLVSLIYFPINTETIFYVQLLKCTCKYGKDTR